MPVILGLIGSIFSGIAPAESFVVDAFDAHQRKPYLVEFVEAYESCADARCRANLRPHIETLASRMPIKVQYRLTQLWSARTRWQTINSARLVKEAL